MMVSPAGLSVAPGADRRIILAQSGTASADSPAARAAAARGSSPASTATEAQGSGMKFRLAPIRWGGSLSDTLAWTSADGTQRLSHTQSSILRGATYIWQPWFAQLSASIGLATSKERNLSDQGGPSGGSGSSGQSITGGASVSLFPLSRFPFTASFDVSDTRTSAELSDTAQRNTRFGMTQSYSPARSQIHAHGSYDMSIAETQGGLRDTVQNVVGSYSMPLGERQQVNANASLAQNTPADGKTGTQFLNATARHNYRQSDLFNVETIATYARTEVDVAASTLSPALSAQAQSFQAGTTATWRPDEESPYQLSGSARYSNASSRTDVAEASFETLNATLFGTYRYSPSLNFSGSLGLTHSKAGEFNSTTTSQSGSASYTGDPIQVLGGQYSWGTGASASNFTSDNGATQNYGLSASHGYSRQLSADERSSLSVNASQSASAFFGGVLGANYSLGTRVSLGWNIRQRENLMMNFNVFGADSRSFGSSENEAQQAGISANGNLQLTRYSALAANITFDVSRQTQSLSDNTNSINGNANGSVFYSHNRAFGIPRLRYTASYTANTQLLNTRQEGNVDAARNPATHALDQRLDYRIGRLDFQSSFRIQRASDRTSALLLFRLNRDFGSM